MHAVTLGVHVYTKGLAVASSASCRIFRWYFNGLFLFMLNILSEDVICY